MIPKIISVIMSGGVGSRLWPVSTPRNPKPYIVLNDGQTFLEKAYRRAAKISNVITTVTNFDHYSKAKIEQDNEHDIDYDFSVNNTEIRPWGSYTVLEESPGFKIKKIEASPGGRLSLQIHQHRSEHWVVVSGVATITNGDDVQTALPNQSAYMPAGRVHRLENKDLNHPCVMIEVQCGQYLVEDDIVRICDDYGRSNDS